MNLNKQKQGEIHIFGEKSKIANWILNHPFQVATGVTVLTFIVAYGDKAIMVKVALTSPLFMFGLASLIRLLCNNLCYRVVIDKRSEKITFFRCFNKGVAEAPIQEVEFLFDKHFAAIYNNERFTIFNEYMAGIAYVLSPKKEIRFSKTLYGRFMKGQFERALKKMKRARARESNLDC